MIINNTLHIRDGRLSRPTMRWTETYRQNCWSSVGLWFTQTGRPVYNSTGFYADVSHDINSTSSALFSRTRRIAQ